MKRILFLLGLLILVLFDSFGQNIPAFPGAEGFGKYTTGGRGGAVYIVTNLNDSGPGSLRWALEAREPRIVVFEVSGTIELQSRLVIRNGNLTIAGQTAPGDGITVKNYPIIIRETGNIVVRFIRSRLGDLYAYHPTNPTIDEDAFSIVLGTKIIIDHCSFSWGTDEVFSIARGWDITLQNSIISEPLGKHNPLGSLNYGDKISYYKNLYAHARIRNPAISPLVEDGLHDIRNILVYNWGFRSIDGGAKSRVNITNSYFKPGPGTTSEINSRNNYENFLFPTRLNSDPTTYGKFFVSGNYLTTKDIASNQWLGVRLESTLLTQQYIESIKNKNSNGKEVPFYIPENLYSKTLSAHEAYEEILNSVGASLNRDIVDKRLINEVKTGTVTYNNSITGYKGIIDSQEDIGGWPILQSLPAPLDTDRDGMPDEWEIAHGLDPHKQDHNGYDLNAQYTNIEVYINSIVSEDAMELTLPGRPTLLTPIANEVLIANQVGFEWNLLNENKTYQLQIATDSTFASLSKEIKGIEGAGIVLSDLAAAQTYFWRIRAGSDEQSTAWSEARSFTLLEPFSNTNSEGLVGHWKMDEGQGNVLIDASGNNNHATLLNISSVSWKDAVLDLGIQLPGTTNRFATKAHNPSLRFEKALTIAGWVKPTRFGRNTILNKNQDGKGFELSLENDGTIAFRINRNGTASNRLVSKFNYEAHLNQWIHVSATFDGTSSKIYINGKLDSQANFSERDITSLGGDLVIGALGTIQRFTGTMDDLRLYDRALTAEEVLALYLLPESLQKPATPILSNPANGQQQLSEAVVFSWEEVSNAESYTLQVSSSENFDQELKEFSELSSPSFSTDQLAFGKTYFWRVQAINANGSSGFSEIFTFETLQAPGKVTLIGPSHQTAGLTIPVELSWEATTRASSYHVQIAFDEAFANLFSDRQHVPTTQVQLTDLSEGTIYFWRVRAENEAGFGSYSDIRNFSTLESSQGESDEGKGESGDNSEEEDATEENKDDQDEDSSDVGDTEGESEEDKGQGEDDSQEGEDGQNEGSEEENTSEGESDEGKGESGDSGEENEEGTEEGTTEEENNTEEETSEGESGEENDESGDDSEEEDATEENKDDQDEDSSDVGDTEGESEEDKGQGEDSGEENEEGTTEEGSNEEENTSEGESDEEKGESEGSSDEGNEEGTEEGTTEEGTSEEETNEEENTSEGESEEGKGESGDSSDEGNEEGTEEGTTEEENTTEEGTSEGESEEGKDESGDSGEGNEEGTTEGGSNEEENTSEGESGEEKGESEGSSDEGNEEGTEEGTTEEGTSEEETNEEENTSEGESEEGKGESGDSSDEGNEEGTEEGTTEEGTNEEETNEEGSTEEGTTEGKNGEEKGESEGSSNEGNEEDTEEENTTEEGTSEGESEEGKGESGDSSDVENEEGTTEGESEEEKGESGDSGEGSEEGTTEEGTTKEETNEEGTSEGESGEENDENEGSSDEGNEKGTEEGSNEEENNTEEGNSDGESEEENDVSGDNSEEEDATEENKDDQDEDSSDVGDTEDESGEEKGQGEDDSQEDEDGQDEGSEEENTTEEGTTEEENTTEEGTTEGESGEDKGQGEDSGEENEEGTEEGSNEEENTSEGESGEENDESGDDSEEGKDNQNDGSEEDTTVINPTAAPARANLISPAHQASNLEIPVQISWEETALASRYHVQIATDENFNELVFEQFNVSANQLAISSLSNGTTYFWRVRAANVIGVGPFSERRSFRTFSTIPLPEQTILGSPADNARGLSTSVRVTWEQAAHATHYQLQVARDQSFQQLLVDEAGIAGQEWNLKDLHQGTTYFWRVRASNVTGFGEYSAIHSFTTLPALPQAPILLSPAVAEVLHHENIRFTWEAVHGAESYQLQVSFNPTFTQSVILTPNNLSSTDFTIGSLEADEVYYWRVRAFNEAGTGAYSEGSSFITSAIPALETPVLVAPRNNSQLDVRNALLKWNAVPGAANYCIQLSTDPAFEKGVETVCAIQGTEYQVQNLKQNQVYYWRVQAMGTSASAYSESWRFEITNKINENQPAKVKVTSYPNPFTDQINLTFTPGFDEALYITVYNSKGIVLFEQTYASSLELIRIPLSSSLPKGMYRVRIQGRSFSDNIGMIKK